MPRQHKIKKKIIKKGSGQWKTDGDGQPYLDSTIEEITPRLTLKEHLEILVKNIKQNDGRRDEDTMTHTHAARQRIKDRPGELNSYACGCWIERDSSGQHHLHYCPLHAAAPALLACVERAYTLEKANHGMTSHAYAYEAALRQAKGETP